jgi:hypothetical protein
MEMGTSSVRDDQLDVLTLEEEQSVAALRKLIHHMRAIDIEPSIEYVEHELLAAGAMKVICGGEAAARMFVLRGVHFAVRVESRTRNNVEFTFGRIHM